MWVISFLTFLANPILGAVLLMSAAVTTGLKVAKVDSELAKNGQPPASYGLVKSWLDRKKAAGKAPQTAKVAKPGMWAYAWQRWQAMWEDLGDQHKQVRQQWKDEAVKAKAAGRQPPPKPTFKETLTGWRWHLDQLDPAIAPIQPTTTNPVADAAGTPAQEPAKSPAKQPAAPPPPTPSPTAAPPAKPPWQRRPGVCGKCGQTKHLTVVGRCDACVGAGGHGWCANCQGLMFRDGDVFRHGPNQVCNAVIPAQNQNPFPPGMPASTGTGTTRQAGRTTKPGNDEEYTPEEKAELADAVQRLEQARTKTTTQPQACEACGGIHPAFKCPVDQDRWREHGIHPDQTGGTTPADNEQGASMTQPAQSGEVTGIPSAVHYLGQMAKTHAAHGDNEALLARMAGFNIGAADIGLVQEAMTASLDAAAMYANAAKTIDDHNAAVRQGYASAPDAADKHAQMAE